MTEQTPDMLIFVIPKKLSDKSTIYNVMIGNVILHAVTEDDAAELAGKIKNAVFDHAVDSVDIVYE